MYKKLALLLSCVLIFTFSFSSVAYAQNSNKSPENVTDTSVVVEYSNATPRGVFNPNAIVTIYVHNPNNSSDKRLIGQVLLYGTAITDGTNLAIRDYSATLYSKPSSSDLRLGASGVTVNSTSQSSIYSEIIYTDPYTGDIVSTGAIMQVFADGTYRGIDFL